MSQKFVAAETINPILPHVSEIILVLIVFAILWYVIAKFVVPALEKAYANRRNEIEGGIERARQAQEEAKRTLEEYQRQLAGARSEAAQIREGARAEAQHIVEEMRTAAQQESARIVARGEESLAQQREQIVRQLRGEIGALAVDLASRIVDQRLADDAAVSRTVDDFLAGLEAQDAATAGAPSGGATALGATPAGRDATVLHAASRASLAKVQEAVEAAGPSIEDLPGTAAALFSVSDLLARNPGLRRTFAEASVETDNRAGLARRLFEGKIAPDALALLSVVVELRWSSPWDLVDGVEGAGNQLLLISAEVAGTLDEVEDQLFRFSRIIGGDSALRSALDDRAQAPDRRASLATSLLAGRADPVTVALVEQGVRSTANVSSELALDDLLQITATRRERSVATVRSAIALTDAQTDRLTAVLSSMYGRTITVRVDVDPAVQGGLVIRIGDELIDGSVVARLHAARGALGTV